jgi:two-component system NarL family response regulator
VPIKVLIADDHQLVREGLAALIGGKCVVVSQAANADQAIRLALETRPDVILLDIVMPGKDGIEVAYKLAKLKMPCKVLIVSQYIDDHYVSELLSRAGAAGFVAKTDSTTELVSAIEAVHAGKRYISSSVAPVVVRQLNSLAASARNGSALTRREREVLKRILEGEASKAIATLLHISPKTVQIHRGNLMAKLRVHSTAELVRCAIQQKLVRVA